MPPAPPVISLRAAHQKGPGATVSVRGVVLNGPELAGLRFVQDQTAGLALYALPGRVPGYDELRPGDSLVATGQLKNYNGLLEMDPITSVQKLGSGLRPRALQVPATDMSTAFAEANEGRLLEITGVSGLRTVGGDPVATLSANTNYLLDGKPAAQLRVHNASIGPQGLVDSKAPPAGEAFNVRGILSQYAPGGTDGYQLLPRTAADLVRGAGLPQPTGELVPVQILPDGFTLEYTTRYAGDTRVSYGRDANMLTEEAHDASFTTQHRITLSGLEPGTTYYVRAGSHNAAGTALSEPVPVITGGKKAKRK